MNVIYSHEFIPVINCFMPKSKANFFYSIYKNTVQPSFYPFTFLLICGNTQKIKILIQFRVEAPVFADLIVLEKCPVEVPLFIVLRDSRVSDLANLNSNSSTSGFNLFSSGRGLLVFDNYPILFRTNFFSRTSF